MFNLGLFGFIASLSIFIGLGTYWSISVFKYKRSRIASAITVAVICTFLSAFLAFLPFYWVKHESFEVVLDSIQHAIKIFTADDAFQTIEACRDGFIEKFEFEWLYFALTITIKVLCIIAPIITFTAILTVVMRTFYRMKYRTFGMLRRRGGETHIFSELNDRTLALAKSLERRKKLIVFADIIDKNEEAHLDLVDAAKELGAILFRKDIASIKIKNERSKRKVIFYLVSDDETEKMRHTRHIIDKYNSGCCKLYLFSDTLETELLMNRYSLSSSGKEGIKGIRINETRFLVYKYLWDNAAGLFKEADAAGLFKEAVSVADRSQIKEINVTVLGYGKHGKEFVKALLWYCQIPNYILSHRERSSSPYQ